MPAVNQFLLALFDVKNFLYQEILAKTTLNWFCPFLSWGQIQSWGETLYITLCAVCILYRVNCILVQFIMSIVSPHYLIHFLANTISSRRVSMHCNSTTVYVGSHCYKLVLQNVIKIRYCNVGNPTSCTIYKATTSVCLYLLTL